MTAAMRSRAAKAPKNVIEDYEMYLSKHPEHVFTAKKGATPTIQQQFKDEYGHDRSLEWLRSYLHKYRVKNNVVIQYRDDKYYTSERKRAAQSLSQAHRSTSPSSETPDALARSMSETPD